MDALESSQGWLALSVLFVECTKDRLILDCIVTSRSRTPDGDEVAEGEPFSVSLNRSRGDSEMLRMIIDLVDKSRRNDRVLSLMRVEHDAFLLRTEEECLLIEVAGQA